VPHLRSMGAQMSVIRSHGYFKIPASIEGIERNKEIVIHLMESPSGLDRVLLVVGIRDACIHPLTNCVANQNLALHCCNSRDLNALYALKEGYCHAASVSLPRIESWQSLDLFNSIQDLKVMRITVAEVEIGLASRDGLKMDDLPNSRFRNHPRGSPERALTDELLQRNGIIPEEVEGYGVQAKTDEGITSAIASGDADAGICRNESANKAGLMWEPLGFESFELVFPMTECENSFMAHTVQALKSEAFRASLALLGGYQGERSGQIQAYIPQMLQKKGIAATRPHGGIVS
jgi:molybdate-binding protein